MDCPHCSSNKTTEQTKRTKLGYCRFQCLDCGRCFNERTGTPFNRLQYPTDVVSLVVLWRLRYKLSLRDLAEMFLQRGIVFTHEAVRDWEKKMAPLISDTLGKRRRGVVCESWYVDETYIKVNGRWCYLYRAIDRDGKLVDSMLSETRDMEAAEAFFRSALKVTEVIPDRVTSDGHQSYPGAVKTVLGKKVKHRTNQYLNNHLEQDHRGIKQRYRPMLGLKAFDSTARFCKAYDELRYFLRSITKRNQKVSLSRRRIMHARRVSVLMKLLKAV